MGRRRITWKLGVSYDAPTQAVKAACEQAVAETAGILRDPAPSVCLTDYGESAIEFTVYCWALSADYWASRCALGERLRETLNAHGVEIPYNHLNIHIRETPAPR